jgi:hypothetical protein
VKIYKCSSPDAQVLYFSLRLRQKLKYFKQESLYQNIYLTKSMCVRVVLTDLTDTITIGRNSNTLYATKSYQGRTLYASLNKILSHRHGFIERRSFTCILLYTPLIKKLPTKATDKLQ